MKMRDGRGAMTLVSMSARSIPRSACWQRRPVLQRKPGRRLDRPPGLVIESDTRGWPAVDSASRSSDAQFAKPVAATEQNNCRLMTLAWLQIGFSPLYERLRCVWGGYTEPARPPRNPLPRAIAQQSRGPGETGPPTFRLRGPTMYWSPNFLPYFQKARNFTASSHQNAGFSIRVFEKKFSEGDNPGPSQHEGATPYRTQHPAPPLVGHGRKCPGVGTQTVGPLQLFSCGCAPGGLKGAKWPHHGVKGPYMVVKSLTMYI